MSIPAVTVYEPNQFSLQQLIAPKQIYVNSSMSLLDRINTKKRFNTSSSLRCMKSIMKNYSKREKDLIKNQHQKYVKSVVKNIYGGLVGYIRNQKSIQQVFQKSTKGNNIQKLIQPDEVVCLQRKYNVELSIKYAVLKQSEDINANKQKLIQRKPITTLHNQPLIKKMNIIMRNKKVSQLLQNRSQSCQNDITNNRQSQLTKNPLQNTKLTNINCQFNPSQNNLYFNQGLKKQIQRKQRKSQKLHRNNFFHNNQQRLPICVKPQSKSSLTKKNYKMRKNSDFSLITISNNNCNQSLSEDKQLSSHFTRHQHQKSCYDIYNNYL